MLRLRWKRGAGLIRPGPQQLGLNLQAEPELRPPVDPKTLRVDRMTPAAPDGQDWLSCVLRVARDLAAADGSLTPSRLRERCATLGLEPPHPNHWGSVWARLRTAGWQRGQEQVSRTATRNAAREAVWTPPEPRP